ncbi:hypothetical protein Tco_1535795, partial [Tanacetum coccineum]
TKACENTGKDYILLPFLTQDPPFSSSSKDSPNVGFKPSGEEEKKDVKHLENEDSEVLNTEKLRVNQENDESVNNTNIINTVSSTVNTASIEDNAIDENIVYGCVDDPNMPNLEEIVYSDDDEDVDAEADMTNLDTQHLCKLTFFLVLQVTQKDDGIFISQDKYVDEILKKFGFSTVKTTSTPMETSKSLMKDENAEDVDVHLYKSMIGSLMYLTSSRPDIIYFKGQPKLGLWYPKDSPFDLEAYTDNDYAGASLDRKSTTGGCQFLGRRLISRQCKKQTVVANSTTEVEFSLIMKAQSA